MRLDRLLVSAVVISVAVAGPCAAVDYVQVATHSPGAAGALYETDLEIRADGGVASSVRVDYLEMNRDNTTPLATTTVVVPAGSTTRLDDLVEDTLGLTWSTGALRLTTLSGTPAFHSRTSNVSAFLAFGYDIAASPAGDHITPSSPGRLIHLTGDAGHVTGLGFVNTSGVAVAATADLYRADGSFYGTVVRTLQPYDVQRASNVFSTGDVPDGWADLSTTTAGGSYLAHAIVVDTSSGEWVVLQARPASGGLPRDGRGIASQIGYLPQARRTLSGQTLTSWTDLEVMAGPNGPATVELELLLSGQPNPSPASSSVTVPTGEAVRLADVLGTRFGIGDGSGALRLTVTAGWLENATAISWIEQGAYGREVPVVSPERFGPHQSAVILELEDSPESHSDIGLLNESDLAATFRVTLVGGGASVIGWVDVTLGAWEHLELADVFAGFGGVPVGGALVSGPQPFDCYGAVVEDTSGDVGFVAGQATPTVFLDGFDTGDTAAW